MFVQCYEVYYANKASSSADGTVCDTFQKEWDIREVWVNKNHITSVAEHSFPKETHKKLPKELIKEAGFSRLQVQNGSHPINMMIVGEPKIFLRKLSQDG